MALERFIPKSPDPFIRNSQDFEVAKFGHLNTIIEYINSYVVTDSLQLAGSGPITSTARYITDSLGNASAISISTTRVGIGTTAPTSELHIDGHNGFGASLKITTNKVGGVAYVQMISDYVTGFEQYQYGGPGWGWPNWTTTRAGGTAAAPTAVPNNYGLNEYSFWGHDGTGGGQAYSMMTRTSETWTTTGHGIYTTFNTVATGSTALVERMRFTGSGNITFNNASDTAKVAIKGTGSTSATTSLLVQNSIGNQLLKVDDEGSVTIGNSSYYYTSPLLTLISSVGSFTMRVGGGNQLQCSASISATNLASNDYVQCIRVLVGNGTVRLTANTTDWLSITDSAQTSNASGNLSAKFGTFGVTYASIDSSAQVEIASTTKGFLPPRMTTTQKNAIASPAAGLVVFDTTLNKLCVYTTAWQTITSV